MTKNGQTKRKILDMLRERQMTLTDISERLNLAPSTVSQHLKELLAVNAIREVETEYNRKWKYYRPVDAFDPLGYGDENKPRAIQNRARYYLAILIASIAIISGVGYIAILGSGHNGSSFGNQSAGSYNYSAQPSGYGKFYVQLTDPPVVPQGTDSLLLNYSGVGLLVRSTVNGSTDMESFGVNGSVNLMNLTNSSKTVAIINISRTEKIMAVELFVRNISIGINNGTYGVMASSRTINATLNASVNGSYGALLDLHPQVLELYGANTTFVFIPQLTAVALNKISYISSPQTGSPVEVGSVRPLPHGVNLKVNNTVSILNFSVYTSGEGLSNLSILVRNNGSSEVYVKRITISGEMDEKPYKATLQKLERIANAGLPATSAADAILLNVSNASAAHLKSGTSGTANGLVVSSANASAVYNITATSIKSTDGHSSRIANISVSVASNSTAPDLSGILNFSRNYGDQISFIVERNGSLEVPYTYGQVASGEGLKLMPGQEAELVYNGTLWVDGGQKEVYMLSNQTYTVQVFTDSSQSAPASSVAR